MKAEILKWILEEEITVENYEKTPRKEKIKETKL
jgi:hypothetical protein